LGFGIHARIAPFIVGQTGDVDAISFSSDGHWRDIAFPLPVPIDAKVIRRDVSVTYLGPVDDLNFLRWGYDYFFGHVAYFGVGHDQHGGAIPFREIEGSDHQIKELLG
jgi:hypothetical protein